MAEILFSRFLKIVFSFRVESMAVMDPMRIPDLATWPEHRRVLARATGHFHNDSRIPGILLGGSFASGTPDFYSDVDLYIIVRDELFTHVLAEKESAAAAAGAVLAGFVPDHLGPGGNEMYIAVYDGPVKVDFNYVRQSTVKPHWKLAHRLVLKDAAGTLAGAIRASAGLAAPSPSRQELEALHNKFWTWCWYVSGKIARGELWEAFDGVHTIRSLALIPIAEWDAHSPREGHRRLESRLDDHARTRLAATVSTLDPTALYGALQAEIHLFRELQAHVWPRYGAPVDETAGRQIEEAIGRSWAGTRGAGARSLEPRDGGPWARDETPAARRLRGLLLKESLADDSPLDLIHITSTNLLRIRDSVPSQPRWWTEVRFEADADHADEILRRFCERLRPSWYLHCWTESHIFVAFAGKVFKYARGDEGRRDEAIEYGLSVGVPRHQLDWEQSLE